MRTIALHVFIAGLLAACSSAATPTPTPTVTPTVTPTIAPSPTSQPSPTPVTVFSVCSPLTRHPLAQLPSLVSWPFDPPAHQHYGVDFYHGLLEDEESALNDPVQTVLDGRIAGFVNDRPPYGNMITIETPYAEIPPGLVEQVQIPIGQSLYHLYAHLADTPAFQVGQSVSCGQALNHVGLTGWTLVPHLHFETRWGPPGFTFTKMAYYTSDATPEEMQNYRTWFLSKQYHVFDPMLLLTLQP